MSQRRRLIGLLGAAIVASALVGPGCGSDGGNGVEIPGDDGGDGSATAPDGTNPTPGDDGGAGVDVTVPADGGGDGSSTPDASELPDGAVILPDGGILLPDGGVIPIPDGGVILPDGGGILLPDGGIVPLPDAGQPDGGGIAVPDGGGTLPDGGTVVVSPDGSVVCVQATCQGKIYACGDCIDNDGDGKIDMNDVGCLGPCDNTETDLTLGIPGGNNAPCKADCYFDQDTGSGNDTCEWDHSCDPHEKSPNYYPEKSGPNGDACEYDWNKKISGNDDWCQEHYLTPGQPKTCGEFCSPLVPNGCDCFGCCTFPALSGMVETVQPPGVDAGAPKYVWLGSLDANGAPSCTADKVTDPTKCHPCTPVKACLNTCEKCELCIGKTTLPPECTPKPPGPIPDGGVALPDGGGTVLPDGGILLPDGGVKPIPDSGVTLPDGAVVQPDGGVTQPDGGTIPPPDGGGTPVCGGQICFSGAACGLACQAPCPTGQFCLTGCCTPNPR